MECISLFSANISFFALNTLVFIGFLNLSLHWPELMRSWQSTESLPVFQNYANKNAYIHRIRLIASSALLLALGDFFPNQSKNYDSISNKQYF